MNKSKSVLLRMRDRDTQFGVTRKTLSYLAKVLGINETDAIHQALAESARKHIPQYEPDDGPLTDRQHDAIDRMTAGVRDRYKETASLFGGAHRDKKNDGKAVRASPRSR